MINIGEAVSINAMFMNTIYESDDFLILSMEAPYDEKKFPMEASLSPIVFSAKGKFTKPSYALQSVELVGEWIFDKKRQEYAFSVQYANPRLPVGEAETIAFMRSIKGIGEKIAKKIWANFKNIEAAAYDANVLAASIKGLSSSAANALCNAVKNANIVFEMTNILKDLVTGDVIRDIVTKHGSDSLEKIKTSPYQLCEDRTTSFNDADAIALFLGWDKRDITRLKAGTTDCIRKLKYKTSGIIVKKEMLIPLMEQTLKLDSNTIETTLETMAEIKLIVTAKPFVYLYDDYLSECGLAKSIVGLVTAKVNPTDSVSFEREYERWKKQNPKMQIAGKQEEAVLAVADNALSVITGGPGTGKTTILQIIIDTYKRVFNNSSVYLMAPTGLAAKIMTKNCKMTAQTIHKTLNLTPKQNNESGFEAMDEIALNGGLIIIDEASMVGLHLAQFMFNAILNKPETRIVVVGDVDQLPSVSPGAFLDDLISCEKVKTTRLNKNFRQEAGSAIIDAAIAINEGNTNINYEGDFKMQTIEDPNLSVETNKMFEEIKKAFVRSMEEFGLDQTYVLTPQRKHNTKNEQSTISTLLSANSINPVLRDLVNPPSAAKSFAKSGGRLFREGDRVINLKNTDKIINGDIGTIKSIAIDCGTTVVVDFYGQDIEFAQEELKSLDLAYAITIHKSQGCEFDSIIIPMSMTQRVMLQRNLLYTAVTRAKKQSLIIGSKNAVNLAIKTTKSKEKKDLLAARIAKYCVA